MYTSINGRHRKVPISFVVAILSLMFIAYYIVQSLDSPPPVALVNTPLDVEMKKPEKVSIGPPVRIIIPKIKVNAILEYVGLNPEGEMEEPTEAGNAAWFNRRPLPGEAGSSVIAGHFGFKDNKPAVFDDLDRLRKGDELHVIDNTGSVIIFVVQELRTYMREQDATEVFSSNDGKSHLNLITCKGAWNESLQSYDSRLVVFAERTVQEADL